MKLSVTHTTRYRYDTPVSYSLQQVRLTPKNCSSQKTICWNIVVDGGSREVDFVDQHNNHVVLISIEPGQSEISIVSNGEVETTDTHGVIGKSSGYIPLWYFRRSTDLTVAGDGVKALVAEGKPKSTSDVERLHDLARQISNVVAYRIDSTHAATTAEDAIRLGQGVCQDHAHIFISAARLLGYPARYVSGYLMMNDRIDQEASHAWAEAYVEGIGWIGFDVSNGISPDERYVRLATGLDYGEAAPISGMRLGSSAESMDVSIQVQQ